MKTVFIEPTRVAGANDPGRIATRTIMRLVPVEGATRIETPVGFFLVSETPEELEAMIANAEDTDNLLEKILEAIY